MAVNGDGPGDGPNTEKPASEKVTSLAERRSRARAKALESPVSVRLAKARDALPPKCPYEPIGFDGEFYYVIDSQHHLRHNRPRDLVRAMIVSLAGDRGWLAEHYPRTRNGKPVDGFAAERAVDDLMNACHVMGFWSADQQIRGRGAWRGEDGDLILHRGDHLMIRARHAPVGRHGEFVYPMRPPLMAMAPDSQPAGPNCAAAELLARLDTFMWTRGVLDSWLMLGWICAAMVGGALDFRPHGFVMGEFQAGKSTLQLLLQCVFGHMGIVSVSDTTAAAIWQAFQCDVLPAGIDEMEAEDDPQRWRSLIKVVRQGSSGGRILRGDVHHRGAEFLIRSCFLCSAILPPPMPSQDLSRFHAFGLLTPPQGSAVRPFSTDRLARIGAAVLRRVADQFRRLVGDVVPLFRERLQEAGFPRRSADLYATLFGAADIALYDDTSTARLDRWLATRAMTDIKNDILADHTAEWRRCLDHLRSSPFDWRHPGSPAVGEMVHGVTTALRSAEGHRLLQGRLFDLTGADLLGEDDSASAASAHHRLLAIGLRVVVMDDGAIGLMVANAHRGLADLFKQTPWATTANAAGGGGWAHALRRAPGARAAGAIRFRYGVQSRALLLPIELVLPDDTRPDEGAGADVAESPAATAAPLH